MSKYAIKASKFLLPGAVMAGGYLTIEDGKFGMWSAEVPEDLPVVDESKLSDQLDALQPSIEHAPVILNERLLR